MENNEDLFLKIPTLSGLNAQEIIEEFGDGVGLWQEYYGQFAKKLPDKFKEVDPFLKWLNEKHPFTMILAYMKPQSIYNWHVGNIRDVVVNLLLSKSLDHGDSHCIFVRNYQQLLTRPPGINLCMNFEELKYEPQTYYLFNSSVWHTVWNIDKPRYLINIDFIEKKDTLSYEKLKTSVLDFYDNNQKG